MADKSFTCSVITPEKQVYDGEVDSVVIPAHDGEIGILYNRSPLVCKLGAGSMRLGKAGVPEIWFIDGGFAQVIENRVIVLTQKAIRRTDLDPRHAEQLLAEARAMKVTDEVSARNKAKAEDSARAQLRLVR